MISVLCVGFGGFTTVSTSSLETVQLIKKGSVPLAGAYALLSVCLCVSGAFLGHLLGGALLRRSGI